MMSVMVLASNVIYTQLNREHEIPLVVHHDAILSLDALRVILLSVSCDHFYYLLCKESLKTFTNVGYFLVHAYKHQYEMYIYLFIIIFLRIDH